MSFQIENIIPLALIALTGGFVQGLTGFGFGLVAAPFFVAILSPHMAVPMIIIHLFIINLIVLVESYKWIRPGRMWLLITASVIGTPFGAYLLTILSPGILKIAIGLLICIFGVLFLSGIQRTIKNEKLGAVSVGFISGLLNSSVSIGGPPVVLFLSNQGMEKKVFRANIVTCFLLVNIASMINYHLNGLMTLEIFQNALLTLPGMFVGVFLGIFSSKRVNEDNFRKIILYLIIAGGISAIVSGFGIL